jgi:hypothetical protein
MVTVSPTTLSFNAVGSGYAQTITPAQVNNGGGFAISSCVEAGVTVATAPATTTGAFSVTPQAAGICTITVTGSGGQTASVGVTVTTTVLNGQ